MTDKVKTDYEALSDAANRFSQESDRIKQVAGRLGHGAENLKRTSWTGKGAEAFFKEVEGSILPAYRRLADALKEASTILKALSKLFQDAEQEASGFVKGTGGGSASGAGADGGEGGGIGDAVAAALGGAFGGAFGGAGAAASGIGAALAGAFSDAFGGGTGSEAGSEAGDASGGDGDLESFPSTLQDALQNALGGAVKPSGNIIEIILQKGQGMADTGMQYGADAGAGGGGPSGAGDAGAAQPTAPQETPTGGGGGGGSPDSGFGGGGQGGGASMVEGGSVGTPLGAGQGFWFGATPGSRLSAAVVTAGAGSVAAGVPAGGDALGLLASFGATAGAAVLGIVGKTVMGKGLKP